MRKYLISLFRLLGLNIQHWHQPFDDIPKLVDTSTILHAIDGGCYKGRMANKMLSTFPNAVVHCFEPQTDLNADLHHTFANEKRIKIYDTALSDHSGETEFHINQEKYTSSVLKPTCNDINSLNSTTVRLETLDNIVEQNNIPQIDFIKLDLQGYELQALKGAKNTFKSAKLIYVEFNFQERYEGCSMFYDISKYLYEAGFILYRLYEVYGYDNGAWKLADALFINKNLI